MAALFAESAFTAQGWQTDVRIVIADGMIATLTANTRAEAGDETVACLIPGLPNLHSHAFQRGMAGLAEWRGPGSDDFWSWREVMYRFALTMSPDDMEAIAAQAYVEMLENGFTRVGEFHYLHHDRDGRAYSDIAEMAGRICAAAETTGIALTLLPVFYAHGNFGGAPPVAGQRRFLNDLENYARLLEASARHAERLPAAVLGVAPHSLRAVAPEELAPLAAMRPGAPTHIHVSEQTKEVDDCLAWSGQRPVAWLLDNAPVDGSWCLIHATHMDEAETARLAARGAVAGLCPVTEANLGDGIFNTRSFREAGGQLGVGTDSNILISASSELRQLEYAQRLRERKRNVLTSSEASTGETMFRAALAGGAQALGAGDSVLAGGARADLVALDLTDPAFAGEMPKRAIDAWIFAAHRPIDRVWVGGRKLVSGGQHVARAAVARRFRTVIAKLTAA